MHKFHTDEQITREVYVNEYFSWAPQLPQIPEELLISNVDTLLALPNQFNGLSKTYTSHEAAPEITELLQPYFPWKIRVRYQVMTKNVHPHLDYSRKFAFNYIIEPGGDDVYTLWLEDDEATEIFKVCAPARTWHRLRLDTCHAVSPHTSPRISLSVWPESHAGEQNFEYDVEAARRGEYDDVITRLGLSDK